MRALINGNMAAAIGAKLCRPKVVSAYPITPQTTIVEYLAKMVADKELDTEFMRVESEHSVMASCIGAAAAGCRVFTATSSHGLLLMHEMLWQASGLRLPIVMVNVNRAVGAPWNIYTDQTDSLAQRDTGWIQFYCENAQEVLDVVIQAFRLAEAVSLPMMVISEGFLLSHTTEPVDIPEQEKVDEFLPAYAPKWKLSIESPQTFGGISKPEFYVPMRRNIQVAMDEVWRVKLEIDQDFDRIFGRCYLPVKVEGSSNPEILLITSGTIASTASQVVKDYPNVSLMKIKMFRPFPSGAVRRVCRGAAKIAVIDRNISFGSRGIFAESVRASLYDGLCHPPIFDFILGIGGADVIPDTISKTIKLTSKSDYPWQEPVWQEDLK